MKQVLTLLAALLLVGGCVAVPTPTVPESRGILGELSGDIKIGEDLEVVGDASIGDDLVVTGDLTVSGSSTVTADPTTLDIGGGFSGGSGSITGCSFTAAGLLYCDGAIYTKSTLGVTGAVTTTASVDVGTYLTTGGGFSGGSGSVTGCRLSADGDLACDGTGYVRGTLGVTGNMTTTGTLDVGSTLNFGANNLYAVGHATSGKAIVAATVSTAGSGHATISHGLTGVDSVTVSLCQAPTTAAAFASAIITSTTVTLNAWDSTLSNRVNGVSLCYLIIGER